MFSRVSAKRSFQNIFYICAYILCKCSWFSTVLTIPGPSAREMFFRAMFCICNTHTWPVGPRVNVFARQREALKFKRFCWICAYIWQPSKISLLTKNVKRIASFPMCDVHRTVIRLRLVRQCILFTCYRCTHAITEKRSYDNTTTTTTTPTTTTTTTTKQQLKSEYDIL
jgi:hypothetical protein